MKKVAKDFGYADAVEMLTRFLPIEGGVWELSRSVAPELFPPQKTTIAEKISRLFRGALKWKD